MHAFMDAFVIGEGEEVIHDIINVIQANQTREDELLALAKIPGVYVPKYYQVHYRRTMPSRRYEQSLFERLLPGLLEIPGLTFYGIKDLTRNAQRVPTVAVRVAGHSPRELAAYLGERGIFTWDGNYYALNLSERLGVEPSGGMLRIGLAHYNTPEEIRRLIDLLRVCGS